MKTILRAPLFVCWSVLGLLFLGTMINVHWITPKLSTWESNWAFVILSPMFVIVPLILLVRDPNRRKSKNVFLRIVLGVGKTAGWLMAVPVFLFLVIVTGTKYGQLNIENAARSNKQAVSVRPEQKEFIDVRGEIHVHSFLSWDSKGTFEEIAQAAKKNGIRWIILTDHIGQLPPGNYPDEVDNVLFIYGQERCHKIDGVDCGSDLRASLKDGERHLNLYGHIEKFRRSPNQQWERCDGIELVSLHGNGRTYLGKLLAKLFWAPEEVYPDLTVATRENLTYWQKLAELEQRPIPIFAAPDAHQNMGILGVHLDPYGFIFKMISTHIWIEKNEDLNQASIFRAIKLGRTYIAFDYLGDTTGFQFWAAENANCIRVELPRLTGKLKIFRDNTLIAEYQSAPSSVSVPMPLPGFWRVEVERDGKPWIVSGQILVK